MSESQNEIETQPTTAIVVLGEAMFFKPQARVISVTLFQREQFKEALDKMAGPESLEIMHVVVKAKEIEKLYDPGAIPEFFPCLKPGCEFNVHIVVGEAEQAGDDDVGEIKTSLVLSGLRLRSDQIAGDGSRIVTAVKPGGAEDEEVSSDEEEE